MLSSDLPPNNFFESFPPIRTRYSAAKSITPPKTLPLLTQRADTARKSKHLPEPPYDHD